MKKLILTIALCAGVSSMALAQGSIAMQNFTATVSGRVMTNTTTSSTGAVLAPTGFHVELLAGLQGATSISNLTSFSIFTSTTGNGQFFNGTVVTMAGIPAGLGNGDPVMQVLALRGWTGAFADYASAVASGTSSVGVTALFNNPTGGGGTPASTPANLIGWLNSNNLILAPVPEPGTIALGGLGVAALLLFRRRK